LTIHFGASAGIVQNPKEDLSDMNRKSVGAEECAASASGRSVEPFAKMAAMAVSFVAANDAVLGITVTGHNSGRIQSPR